MSDDVNAYFDGTLRRKFEFHSYRNAATILANRFPAVFENLKTFLSGLELTETMIRMPGGNKGLIVTHIDEKIDGSWKREARISADLIVGIKTKKPPEILEYTNEGYLDGHQIDYLSDRVALDVEWNSKDQTFDRDLYAMSAFYQAGAIDLGILITRGTCIDSGDYLRSLGKVLKKDGTEGEAFVYPKFGASTTNMNKLLYRLEAGRNGGCPVLVVGLKTAAFAT